MNFIGSLSIAVAAAGTILAVSPAHASLIITPIFDSSITSDPNAAGIEGAIDAAIGNIESSITSTRALTVDILYAEQSSGLGNSVTGIYTVSYDDFYNQLKSAASQPAALSAVASLGLAPTNSSSPNPVNGSDYVAITSAEGRNLGFATPAAVTVNGTNYDSEILLNTSATYPPEMNNGSNYGLQAVATHETDEALGIGGTGSTIGEDSSENPQDAVGDLDLFRYSAPGVRSYSTTQTTSPYSYLSVDAGMTVVSYFNQTAGADYGDWLSNPIPPGFGPQVQDAFGEAATDPVLGLNELTAFNAIGYQLVAPEPASILLSGFGLALGYCLIRRRRSA